MLGFGGDLAGGLIWTCVLTSVFVFVFWSDDVSFVVQGDVQSVLFLYCFPPLFFVFSLLFFLRRCCCCFFPFSPFLWVPTLNRVLCVACISVDLALMLGLAGKGCSSTVLHRGRAGLVDGSVCRCAGMFPRRTVIFETEPADGRIADPGGPRDEVCVHVGPTVCFASTVPPLFCYIFSFLFHSRPFDWFLRERCFLS